MQNVREEEDVPRVEAGCDVLHSQDRTILSHARLARDLTVKLTAQVGQDDPQQLQALVDSHESRIDLSLLDLQHQVLNLPILCKEVLQENFS